MRRPLAIILLVLIIPNLILTATTIYGTYRLRYPDSVADDFASRIKQPPLVALRDPDPDVRICAAWRLSQKVMWDDTGKIPEAAIPLLAEGLRDSHAGVRRAAGEALRWAGEEGVTQLVLALDDGRREVRISAAKMLLWETFSKSRDLSFMDHDKHERAKEVLAEAEKAEK